MNRLVLIILVSLGFAALMADNTQAQAPQWTSAPALKADVENGWESQYSLVTAEQRFQILVGHEKGIDKISVFCLDRIRGSYLTVTLQGAQGYASRDFQKEQQYRDIILTMNDPIPTMYLYTDLIRHYLVGLPPSVAAKINTTPVDFNAAALFRPSPAKVVKKSPSAKRSQTL